ncbi:MAG: ATP-binding protein, partial [Planctomycetota bacterium]
MQDRALATNEAADAVAGLEALLATAWPAAEWRDVNVAVAVSGGADSVALLRVLESAKRQAAGRGELVVLHYNHRVRG